MNSLTHGFFILHGLDVTMVLCCAFEVRFESMWYRDAGAYLSLFVGSKPVAAQPERDPTFAG